MAEELDFPVLFGTTRAAWAPIDCASSSSPARWKPAADLHPFAVLRCHSRLAGAYRPHLPHPDYDCLYGYGDVELVGAPQLREGAERTVAVKVMPPRQAASFLAGKGRAWEADLYRLAARRRAADTAAPTRHAGGPGPVG
jgi:hypothetical protein